jgi:alpha-L-rhamnosidase
MESQRPGAAQTAYRIEVFDAAAPDAPVWDSGEVADGRSTGVRYAGSALRSAAKYSWRVSVKDETGEWLEPATGTFSTGLLSKDDWKGSEWISAVSAPVSDYPSGTHNLDVCGEAARGTACFVKTLANGKSVKEAWWTVTGLGVFDCHVNGKAVGCDFLKPGFTHCEKTKHAFTYDVTPMMEKSAGGRNTFSAQVSAGWWRDKIVNFRGKKSAFRAQLLLRYDDGTEERVGTDPTWLSALAGPVLTAAIFDGEDYDARIGTPWMRETDAAALAAFGFRESEINREFKGEIVPMEGPSVRMRRDLALAPAEMYVWKGVEGASEDAFGTAVKTRRYADGDEIALGAGETLIVDFGQNAAAVPEFSFSAARGVTLTARPAEMLNDGNGAKSRGCDGPEGSAYFTNYREARTTLNYTFAGEGVEAYHPSFTYFGYRYLSVTATGDVKIKSVRSVPVTSIPAGAEAGAIETGVADLNRLVKNILWGQYSNYLSVPTDCPQRNERLGWTADTQVFAGAASCNADVYGFLAKWMRDMRDTVSDDGSFPSVAPLAQYCSGNEMSDAFGWSDAGVIVPYVMWRRYGDTRIIGENWDAMARYVAFVEKTKFATPKGLKHQWGDWLSYEKLESCGGSAFNKGPDGERVPKADALAYWRFLGCCYWLWDAEMMSEMGAATGRDADAKKYRDMAAAARGFLRDNFLSKDNGMLIPLFRDMQTPALFALRARILSPEAAKRTAEELVKNIKDHGDCLQTGFLGTSILMDTLTYDAHAPEVAYTLLLQHKNPSWLYSVDQGATTVWERWNSYTKADGFGLADMNSFNHYAYGAVLSWMYGTMAGIREDPSEPGFRHIILAPVPDRRVGSVVASFRSPYGTIKSAWRYEGDKWIWTFTIPANATATVVPPGGEAKEYKAGSYTITVP